MKLKFQGKPFLSKRGYYISSLIIWIHALAWPIILLSITGVFPFAMPKWLKIVLLIVIFIPPQWNSELFKTYEEYCQEFEDPIPEEKNG